MPSKTVVTLATSILLLQQLTTICGEGKYEYHLSHPWPYVQLLSILKDILPEVSICFTTTQFNPTNCSWITFRLSFVKPAPPTGSWPIDERFLWEQKLNNTETLVHVKQNVGPVYGWTSATISRNHSRICLNLFNVSLKANEKELKIELRCHNATTGNAYQRHYGLKFRKKDFCNGRIMDEKIIEVQPSPAFFSGGSDAVINWTYCKANVSSIFGFNVYRDLYPRIHFLLLSMDLNGKVSYIKNKEVDIKSNRIVLEGNDHLISFTIKNVSTNDSGYYRLEIQRHKYDDLESRVQITVEPSEKITNYPITGSSTWSNERNATSDGTSSPSQVGRDGGLSDGVIAAIVVVVVLSVIIAIIIIFVYKRCNCGRPEMDHD